MDQMSKIDEITSSAFKGEVLESDVPVVVDFWAPWCGPCRMVTPVLEDVSQKMNGKIKFVKLNTDENQKIAMDYQIMAIPSLLIFKNGQEVDRIVGFVPQEQLEADLQKIIS
jgi:thioredoxin 1